MLWLHSTTPVIGILLLFQRTAEPTSQQYRLIDAQLTWYEAQSFCRVKYADLATVNHMDDKNKLVNMLGSGGTNSWIGLRRGGTYRWMWSDGSGVAQFAKWNGDEPNNFAGNEWCAEISETGSWNDIPCAEEKGVVCYDRQPGGGRRYEYYSDKKRWVDGLDLCRSQHTDLAYVSNEADNSEIATLAKSWTGLIWMPNKVWFGLFKDAWMWSDGRETSFRYWLSSTQDRGDCVFVAASHQGRWVDGQCHEKATFVCQGDLKVKKMVIRMMVRLDADFTNSTVSDELLKKFETGLRQRRMTDFNLSWRRDKEGIIFRRHEPSEVTGRTGC